MVGGINELYWFYNKMDLIAKHSGSFSSQLKNKCTPLFINFETEKVSWNSLSIGSRGLSNSLLSSSHYWTPIFILPHGITFEGQTILCPKLCTYVLEY